MMVTSGDASIFVRTIGGYDGGPTLIVLHGGPGLSHEYTLGLAALASDKLRVVFYDQREVGRSTGIAASYDPLQEWADDLEAVRKAVGVARMHLLGHSAGGFPAMVYNHFYPGYTESIIFVDSVSPTGQLTAEGGNRATARVAVLQASGHISAELPQDTPENADAILLAVMPVYFADPTHPGRLSLNGAKNSGDVNARTWKALGDYDLRPLVAQLIMPTLSFIAPFPFGVEVAGSLYEALPKGNAQAIFMDDCGHLPFVECPDMFFSEVNAFLKPFIDG
jgi:proline iminopeptidase